MFFAAVIHSEGSGAYERLKPCFRPRWDDPMAECLQQLIGEKVRGVSSMILRFKVK